MNAQISPLDFDGFSFGKKTNRNGSFMLDRATASELIICDTTSKRAMESCGRSCTQVVNEVNHHASYKCRVT